MSKTIIFTFTLFATAVFGCVTLIKSHFSVVQVSYQLSDLDRVVKKNRAQLQRLKVERAELLVPSFLDNAAGRGGYSIPRMQQIVILPPVQE
jgi:hypothetical protein